MQLSNEYGYFAVRIARKVIEKWVKGREKLKPKSYPEFFNKKMGVFTTIHAWPEKELRGCIGFPYPELRLIDALVSSAIEACNDPRFLPLRENELEHVVVEVSILTEPKLIDVENKMEYLKKIEIGKDGLIIKNGIFSGLLLPQVPVEFGWNVKQYLENLCEKAMLPRNAWLFTDTQIFKFQAFIFAEKEPNGDIERVKL